MEALVPDGPLRAHRAAELVADLVRSWLTPTAPGSRWRATSCSSRPVAGRSSGLALDEVRRAYLLLVEQPVRDGGCRDPHRHAPQLLALLDGLVLNQLLQPATELPDDGLVDQLERFFSSC